VNILLISECTKHALTETRRILDQFAERRGERTWQTPITEAGLSTLHKLLRKSARKNTAVACHWIRGRNYSELLWVVGDRNRFNRDGAVPTNTTKRNVLRSSDENDWQHGEDIRLLSGMAALLHDLGKSCKAFQDNLRSPTNSLNMLRHEWISLRLFQAFVGCDDDITWLKRFQKPCEMQPSFWRQRLEAAGLRDGVDDKATSNKPLSDLPPLAASIGWLILTHHRLPLLSKNEVNMHYIEQLFNRIDIKWNNVHSPNWCKQFDSTPTQEIKSYWIFDCDLPINDAVWQKYATKLASRLEKRYQKIKWLDFPYIMHLSRLTLMLSDHYYSSLTKQSDHFNGQNSDPVFTKELYANKDKEGNFNQTLREHLVGVASHSDIVCHALPNFEYHLPSLLKCRKLQRRSTEPYFDWQNKSAELAMSVREQSRKQGAFIVNMASTGCGKTLANARVMYELSDSKRGMRCIFALGLRTLTMQTGRIFQEQLELREDQLEIMVGGSANRELFEFYAQEAEKLGAESSQCLWDEQINNSDSLSTTSNENYHPLLARLTKDARMRALLNAPLLVCTIDHIMPATESKRGGRQIIPMLRLMSSDLVLDEPDDFDLSDLPALSRLVYWAGLLGSRVLLSSATLPPTLVVGLFEAYLAGRREYQLQREENTSSLQICCLWLDENQQHYAQCNSKEIFSKQHKLFALERYTWLTDQSIRRTSRLIKVSGKFKENEVSLKQEAKYLKYDIFNSTKEQKFYFDLAHTIYSAAIQLHKENAEIDLISQKQVSFGLIRIANIEKLYKVALALYALEEMDDIRIHLCVYHSQYPLLLRSSIENQLDKTLDRKDPTAVFRLPDIQNKLQTSKETNQLFVVLGSPVTEVGRDHDYDWAIIEPSSMRSLIQLAGRVRRHRMAPYKNTNLLIFEQNIRSLLEEKVAYCKPGFEQENECFRLKSHNLQDLLLEVDYKHLDARARIVEPQEITPEFARSSLIGLEHACLRDTIYKNFIPMQPNPRPNSDHNNKSRSTISASTCWQMKHAMLSALLPEYQPFRQNDFPEEEIVLLTDSNQEKICCVKLIDDHKRSYKKCELPINSLFHELPDDFLRSSHVTIWGQQDYLQALKKWSEEMSVSLDQCARRYGVASVPKSEQGWLFHSALGFIKKR